MNYKLHKELLEKEYNKYKTGAFDSFKNQDYARSLAYIKFCGYIAWNYPILYNYCDDDLEELMLDIKRCLELNKDIDIKIDKGKKKTIFYNSQIVDSGGLTEQYLHFFIENGYQVLFIIPDEKNTCSGKNIIETIQNNSNIQLCVIQAKSNVDKISEIDKIIKEYGAETAFLHFIPNDIVGYSAFSDKTWLKRFYIVHNDHTFWFGKGCSDMFIEFRRIGYELSVQRRKIDYTRIVINPFYPIIQKNEFQGLPFDSKGKVVGLSGGNMYKYYLDPQLKYFHAIKELIRKNNDFIFCLAGSGDVSRIRKFVKNNDLGERFFILGNRSDFFELVKHVDILFESYPMKGGLTVLYAVENKKAITGIGSNQMISIPIEDFLDLNNYRQPENIENFIKEADDLIKVKEHREENAQLFQKSKYRKPFFDKNLDEIINGTFEQAERLPQELTIDETEYLNEFLRLPQVYYIFFYLKRSHLKEYMSLRERVFIFGKLKLLQIHKVINMLFTNR